MDKLKEHPIQLQGILVKELFVRVNDPSKADKPDDKKFQLGVGHSNFNSENNTIDVGLFIKIGQPEVIEEKEIMTKFDLKVHLLAKFIINQEEFPINQIGHWAEHNAPLILYPYIREHVHALSIRAGISPILLPLMEVPTISLAGK